MLSEALRYYDLGFSVIPIVYKDKKSLVPWQEYQTKRATREQVEIWFKNPELEINIGIVTGAISGIVVVDIDTTESIGKPLPPTATSRTGRGGSHHLYKHPGALVKTVAGILPGVDIRGDGGIIVLPPSIHPNGNKYEWVIPPEDGFEDMPDWVFGTENRQTVQGSILDVVPEGTRNSTATKVAGQLLGGHLSPELSILAWEALKKWNQETCKPPLIEKELRTIFESIYGREERKRDNTKTVSSINSISLSELIATEFPAPLWLVDKLIPNEALTIISGAPASYKTFITIEIALKVAGGEKVFGHFPATQCPVLIIDEENNPRILKERTRLLSTNSSLPIYFASKGNFLLNEESVKNLIEHAKKKEVGLVIIDSLICIHDSDENSASGMRTVMKLLKEITKNGIATVVIHHHRKRKERGDAKQDIRGSSDILAQVDCHLAVERKNQSVIIHQSKLREAKEMEPITVKFNSDASGASFEYMGTTKQGQNKRSDLKNAIKKALEASDTSPNRTALWKLLQQAGVAGGEATFKTALKEMTETKELFTIKGTKNSTLYFLKAPSLEAG